MSLQPKDRGEIPADTAALGRKLLNENHPCRLIGDRLSELIRDEDFRSLYTPIGGPAISPALLALVTVFQMMEKLPDRLAAEAVVLRIDWKYALHLPLDYAGFHYTNLEHFRQRLIAHQAEYLVFDRLLSKLLDLGLIRRRGKQRTDSSHVLGLVARLSRLELVRETLRVSLEAIRKLDERWLERSVPEAILHKYLQRRNDFNLTEQQVASELRQTGADGWWWQRQLEIGPAEWRQLPETQTLRTVWEQQFELDEHGDYGGPRSKLEGHNLLSSPHEPEVRYRAKRGKPWLGYMGQLTETAEAKGDPNFITDVAVTDGHVDDTTALPDIQTRLAKRDLTPEQQIVDQNYLSGPLLAKSRQRGIELIGPIVAAPGPEGFKLDDFQYDWISRRATCPAGQTSAPATINRRRNGSFNYQFRFGRVCAACPHRATCTPSTKGRTLNYPEHHAEVKQRRAEMQTEEYRQLMKRRPPVEGTLSQLLRMGARRARYRGRVRVNLQVIFIAVAVNLRRLCRVWATSQRPSWATTG